MADRHAHLCVVPGCGHERRCADPECVDLVFLPCGPCAVKIEASRELAESVVSAIVALNLRPETRQAWDLYQSARAEVALGN